MSKGEKIKIVYIISNINSALAFEWLATSLLAEKYQLTFILLNPVQSTLADFLREVGCDFVEFPYKGKADLPKVWWKVFKVLKRLRPEIVHTHLFDANLIGLSAALVNRVPYRIYTRHHSTLHHVYYPRAVYYDRFINKLSTRIIAISNNVYEVLHHQEQVPDEKIALVHHGFKLADFSEVEPKRTDAIRVKYQLDGSGPIIGVIARYTHWKGIQYIIPAFEKYLQRYPNAKLVLANAKGDYLEEIRSQLKQLPVASYVEIEFEADITALYQVFDMYIHVPIDEHSEAFGQTYVEALAARIPSIFTLSGVSREFIKDGYNAYVVPFKNSKEIYHGMVKLTDDGGFMNKVRRHGQEDVHKLFTFDNMIEGLIEVYEGSARA